MKSISIILILLFSLGLLSSQNIGIENSYPQTKLHLGAGDIFLDNHTQGIIMKSPDGNCWKQAISNTGVPNYTSVPCPGTSTITFGGQTYKTKLMPDGKWWMTENLNIGDTIHHSRNMTNNNIIEKFCPYNNLSLCNTYGGLYQWAEAVQYKNGATDTSMAVPLLSGFVQGICPNGWHIPSEAEWNDLKNSLMQTDVGSQLSSNALLWNDGALETSIYFNTSGFSALPAGIRSVTSSFNTFSFINYYSDIWYSTERNSNTAWNQHITSGLTTVSKSWNTKVTGLSVRCLKDY